LLLISTEQNDDRTLAGGLVLTPVGGKRCTPHRNSAKETILAGAATCKEDQTTQRLAQQFTAASAFTEELNLALLSKLDAVSTAANFALTLN
jgi:hypothetical protein